MIDTKEKSKKSQPKLKLQNNTVNGTKENAPNNRILCQISNYIANNGSSNGLDKNHNSIKTTENGQSKRTIIQKLHDYRKSIR